MKWYDIEADRRTWMVAFGIVAGGVTAAFNRDSSLLPFAVLVAGVLGGVLGWQCAGWWQVFRIVAKVRAMGGMEGLLDEMGREWLTVWIPFEHRKITDDDMRRARALGFAFRERYGPNCLARLTSVETRPGRVGIAFTGKHFGKMLTQVRPFFKEHCPRGTYVTRSPYGKTPERVPLFEDDKIPHE